MTTLDFALVTIGCVLRGRILGKMEVGVCWGDENEVRRGDESDLVEGELGSGVVGFGEEFNFFDEFGLSDRSGELDKRFESCNGLCNEVGLCGEVGLCNDVGK